MNVIEYQINLFVDLYADQHRVFLRVWNNVKREGPFVDCTMNGHRIPVVASARLTSKNRVRVLNLTRRFFAA